MSGRRFLRFLAVGGVAALVNFGSRLALSGVMAYVPAIVLAYLLGMATAFALNRRYVFAGAGNALSSQLSWFVLINLVAVAQTVLVSLLLARGLLPALGWHWQAESIAHAVGIAVPVVTSYFGHKRWSFARRPS